MTFIDENTTREELIAAVDANLNDIIDAFLDADVDPHLESTPTDAIRAVVLDWIKAGDETAAA